MPLADSAPVAKDVVIATLGASAALGGLILVFLGFVIANYQATPATATKETKDRAKRPVGPALGAFLLSMGSVGISAVWLDSNGSHGLYEVNLIVFIVEIVAVSGLAISVAWGPMRGK